MRDYQSIINDAVSDVKRSDYSSMTSYLDDLESHLDNQHAKIDNLLSELVGYGFRVDEHGSVSYDPIILMNGSEQITGTLEVMDLGDTETREQFIKYYYEEWVTHATSKEFESVKPILQQYINRDKELYPNQEVDGE